MRLAASIWVARASRVLAMASSPARTFRRETFPGEKVRFGETPKPARETRALPGTANHAFTLIELLIVMAIIIVLAGLILATSSYVQEKGKRSRAEAEIAAISAALESYKADNGTYPRDSTTDDFDSKVAGDPSTSTNYFAPSLFLYNQMAGTAAGSRTPTAGAKTYFPFKPNMLNPSDQNVPVTYIRDPFDNSYGYSTAFQKDPITGYNPTFDIWSTAGSKKPGETDDQYQQRWLKNW